MKKIRLAIVDDSSFVRKVIQRLFEDEPTIEVVGTASTGEELIKNLNEWQPDVITLDLSMPGMGGLRTLDHIMAWKKIPVIILSTHSSKDAPITIEALHRGAADFIDKQQYSLVDFDALRAVLSEKIKQLTSKVIPHTQDEKNKGSEKIEKIIEPVPVLMEPIVPCEYAIILIGASTGGPPAIQYILESLSDSLQIPVAIVQHMPTGFTAAFANRLNQYLPLKVKEASNEELMKKDTIYIAPAGFHLTFKKQQNNVYLILSDKPNDCLHKPSVDILFKSAAEVFGKNSIGIILTGMGKDGAKGAFMLYNKGAYTIAQDESTCTVFGMPKAALLAGAVRETLPLYQIPQRIIKLLNK